jgi:phosphoadenosine phosphosulfate reductase
VIGTSFQAGGWEQLDSQSPASKTRQLDALLGWCWEQFGASAGIGTSFQPAGLVIIDHAVKAGLEFPVFTIDTGLLFPETVALKERLESFFGISIESLQPEESIEEQGSHHGPALWERDPNRCCALRKIAPLQKRLETLGAWITGLRRDQSNVRATTPLLDLIRLAGPLPKMVLKINPLAAWNRTEVWDYVNRNRIPINPLFASGYRSIGCQPCTNPVRAGQGERAGRWSKFEKTECGIHTCFGGSEPPSQLPDPPNESLENRE